MFYICVVQVEFLADNAYIVICTQEYTAETCDPPVMKLVKYSDNKVTISKEDDKSSSSLPDIDISAATAATEMEDAAVGTNNENDDEKSDK